MNYHSHYERLVARARNRVLSGYVEVHHVTPKCLGGSNDASNLVQLTAEEHFVAHQLLHKMYPNVSGLAFSLIAMTGNPHGKRSNKLYGWMKKKLALTLSTSMKERWQRPSYRGHMIAVAKALSPDVRKKAADSNRGRRRSLETRLKMSAAAKSKSTEAHAKQAAARRGAKRSTEICLKMSQSAMAMSPEARARIRAARWPRPTS